MLQSSTHSLEVLAAELTHDVRRVSFGSSVGSALYPWRHAVDFVLDQGLPVFAVDVAALAVEVSGVVELVALHVFLVVEGLVAAFFVAWYGPDGLEGGDHIGGLERGELLVVTIRLMQ